MLKNRILHKNQIIEFTQFVDDKAYYIEDNKGEYEILRFRTDPKKSPGLVYKNKTPYLTCNDLTLKYVKMFNKER